MIIPIFIRRGEYYPEKSLWKCWRCDHMHVLPVETCNECGATMPDGTGKEIREHEKKLRHERGDFTLFEKIIHLINRKEEP